MMSVQVGVVGCTGVTGDGAVGLSQAADKAISNKTNASPLKLTIAGLSSALKWTSSVSSLYMDSAPPRIPQRRHEQEDPHPLVRDRHPQLTEIDLQLTPWRRLEP